MDPRVRRSRAALKDALMYLAHDNGLDEITVADITAHAQVNRSTFYQHYPDKETLLAEALQDQLDSMASQLLEDRPTPAEMQIPVQLLAYLQHIRDNATLYRRVLSDHSSGVVATQLRTHIGSIAGELISELLPEGVIGLPSDVLGEAIGGTAVGVVTAWLRRDPLPPIEHLVEWMWPLLIGPFSSPSPGDTPDPTRIRIDQQFP